MNKNYKNIIFVLTSLLIVGLLILFYRQNHYTASTQSIYYMDSLNGNDLNLGTSSTQAWKSLAKLNSALTGTLIKPGDVVLFKKGQTFNGSIIISLSGIASSPISFSSYGTSTDKPIINAAGFPSGIELREGKRYFNFQDLKVINAVEQGVILRQNSQSLSFKNMEITNSKIGINIDANIGMSVIDIALDNISSNNNSINGLKISYGENIIATNLVIDGNLSDGVFLKNSKQISFDNLTSNNNGKGETVGGKGSGILVDTVNDLSVSNSFLNQNKWDGFYSYGITTNVNIFKVIAQANFNDGFSLAGNANVTFDKCIANSNGMDGLGSDGDGFTFHSNSVGTIKNSKAINNKKAAIANTDHSKSTIFNNVLSSQVNGTKPSVYLVGDSEHSVYNNTIVNNSHAGEGIGVFMYDGIIGPKVKIKNNIIYGFEKGITKEQQVNVEFLENFNLFYNNSINVEGFLLGQNSKIGDPLFVNMGILDLRLKSSSPGIDSAEDLGITYDYIGNTRQDDPSIPNSGIGTIDYYDIGAFEFQPPKIIFGLSADKPSLSVGEILTYNLIIKNENNYPLSNIIIEAPIPSGTIYEPGSASAGGVLEIDKVKWNISSLNSISQYNLQYKVKILPY